MSEVFGIVYTNNGSLDVFYTYSMDFCPQGGMVSSISHENGNAALVISVSLDQGLKKIWFFSKKSKSMIFLIYNRIFDLNQDLNQFSGFFRGNLW